MCLLCVIQKYSRRVATMLPWLVLPLIGLWALSQLLPPTFRFEITSPRLACVFVLLLTLFWYEVLVPHLSDWRARRNALFRERKRFEAVELQKLRKTATRKCRNCLTPYRDQNPSGGKFMCSYCGHISKRPVLDLPIPPGLGISNSGIIRDLFGKCGKMLNGKVSSDNGSNCPEWLEQENWIVGGTFTGNSTYMRKNVDFSFRGEQCLDEKPYPQAYLLLCKWLMPFLRSLRWLWRKLYVVSLSREDDFAELEHKAVLAKSGENGMTFHESRGEKARRKAEEKRQARLEKELLEEEERKQREEVARLVEECRRLRDEKVEAENRARGLSFLREKDKKYAEKRHDRRKEKDKGSSKSNSDVEELEKKVGKETERGQGFDKNGETDKRESQRMEPDIVGGLRVEAGQGVMSSSTNNSQGNVGTRYFDRMKGTLLSSSRAFTSHSFFSKVGHTNPPISKDSKFNGFICHSQVSANRRELCPPDSVSPKVAPNGDDKNINCPVRSDLQHKTASKSWQQLFTLSSAVPAPSNANVISRPIVKSQAEVHNSLLSSQLPSVTTYDNPISFGFPSPFDLPTFSDGSINNISGLPSAKDQMFLRVGDTSQDLLPKEPELFEDPCYVPDPVSLLGPVSESLDNFQSDQGTGFILEGLDKTDRLMNVSASLETGRQSPIESPISRLRVAGERQNNSNGLCGSHKVQDMHPFPACETRTWQMWNTSLGLDLLGLGEGCNSWIFPLDNSRSSNENIMHSSSQRTMASLFTNDDPVAYGTYSPQKIFLGNCQNDGAFSLSVPGSNDHDHPWMQKTLFPPPSRGENHFPTTQPTDDTSNEKIVYGSPSRSAANRSFDLAPASCWTENEWACRDLVAAVAVETNQF
ncbi:hypothetical protein Nepgr_011852 [Nepenthes gracilis]|uniref:Stress response NST1-like protein n=1 Tax=Nepenthes gracilis TaxID=150966 RepID=A0AAD3SFV6_NEPGR|nr:hypothetical protein Nepgr_011852 [Nepenthes gracilis]